MSSDDVVGFYEDRYRESDRLLGGSGYLELLRTQHIIGRRLEGTAWRIADIGGGPGVYAQWLAGLGHDVELVDPVSRHVDQAGALAVGVGSIRAQLGDARSLPFQEESIDAVLLLGPLYHLPDRADRSLALSEAMRVLRPGGRLFAAAISRFASIHDGLVRGLLRDPEFAAIAAADVETGRHENPKRHPDWFTSAYFHRPAELRAEVLAAGATDVSVHGIEGLVGWLDDLDERLDDPRDRAIVLDALDRVGTEPSLLGVSAHLLACAIKPA